MKEILSLQHEFVKHLVKLRQNSDYRFDHNALVIEGIKIIGELGPSITFKSLLTTSLDLIPKGVKVEETILVSPQVIQKISGLKSPEGILAEVVMPKSANLKGKKFIIGIDQINDPGNLGTILRTALALNWDGIFLLNETCDPFNDKALRASRGAALKIPIARGTWQDLQNLAQENKLQLYVADTEGIPFNQTASNNGMILILGNEAHGPSEEILEHATPITIPMPGNMESLNVSIAAGILLYNLRRKLKQSSK